MVRLKTDASEKAFRAVVKGISSGDNVDLKKSANNYLLEIYQQQRDWKKVNEVAKKINKGQGGWEVDRKRALELIKKSANAGQKEALLWMGIQHEYSLISNSSEKEALNFYEKAKAKLRRCQTEASRFIKMFHSRKSQDLL